MEMFEQQLLSAIAVLPFTVLLLLGRLENGLAGTECSLANTENDYRKRHAR
jgi:hypothetical protein